MAVLSKFAHKLEKNGYIARFNALKNIPVFYRKEYDIEVEKYIATNADEILSESIEPIIKLLLKNKVLVESPEYDDSVLQAIQNAAEKPYISVMYLILTEKCNFDCSYCFIERHMDLQKANVMSKETAKKAIDFFVYQIKKQPKLFEEEKAILFYGGEPLSNYSVLKYAANLINRYIREGKLPVKTELSLVTNGSLLTESIAKELSQMGVSFSISLDGATAKANQCRIFHGGKPAYENIINGIKAAKQAGVDFGLSITLSEEALAEKENLLSFLDEYDIKGIGYNILNTDKTFTVAEDYYERASAFIIDSFIQCRNKGIYEDRIMRKINSYTEHKLHYFDCAAEGGHQIVVAPNGEVGLCHGYLSSRETFITNVEDYNFDPLTNPLYLEWGKRTPLNMPQCYDCMALGVCGGGCALCAAANGNSIWDLDKGFCVHSKATLEFLVWELFDKIKNSEQPQNGNNI